MTAGYSAFVSDFLQADRLHLVETLCTHQVRSFRINEAQQLRAWDATIGILRAALCAFPAAHAWRLILEFPMHRLGRRIDALLITPRGVLVLEFKAGADRLHPADRRQVEDYALDLQDFHSACRGFPILPILIATGAQPAPNHWPLLLAGAAPPMDASAATLGGLLDGLWRRLPEPAIPLDVQRWEHASYRPVPGIVDAACMLYDQHGVADIAAARAAATNLTTTTRAILAAIQTAQTESGHIVLFVTGIPGAGKTLCGLNAVFGVGRDSHATFLTGNPTLIHVLREALARDAAYGERIDLRAARRRTETLIQSLPHFRDEYVRNGQAPSDRIVVIDEAQRAWSRDHAIRKSLDRSVRLTDSEPGHLLEIMGRHGDWAVMVCLIGQGQEIHDGEGGLAEWGVALAAQPKWRAMVSPMILAATEPRQMLPVLPGLHLLEALHLDVPVRNVVSTDAASWVDAVMADRAGEARAIADGAGALPFRVTRSLAALRTHLRAAARGNRRAGLVASSGAKRLRADGLGSELPHMDAGAVARWFLDRWPEDVRASDALEQVATEFSCQGLELDYVGLCWGGDLIRGAAWQPRAFRGTRWQAVRQPEAISNRINTYRVLLTRARYETVIWVPQGDPADRTRSPAEMDAVAAHLLACGAEMLGEGAAPPVLPERQAMLL